MQTDQPLLLCEPQCIGFEHVPVNAALLEVFRNAFPKRELIFAAETEHDRGVRSQCARGSVIFKSLPITPPDRDLSHINRYFPEKRLFSRIIEMAEQNDCTTVIFTSLTDTCFYLQKRYTSQGGQLRFINFLHGMFQSVLEKAPWKPWKKMFWFPELLRQPIPENILFFVYGESIRKAALALRPHLSDRLFSLDHPCFFHTPLPKKKDLPLRIGALGIGGHSKGTHLFFELAVNFRKQIEDGLLEFIQIGPVFDKKIQKFPEFVHIPSPGAPLERSRYEQLVSSIDYAMLLYDKEAYRLIASGAFMDAISFARPVIALENPFFNYYFKQFGNIGYLCPGIEEIGELLHELQQTKEQQHHIQVMNIIEARKSISFQCIGSSLAKKLAASFQEFS